MRRSRAASSMITKQLLPSPLLPTLLRDGSSINLWFHCRAHSAAQMEWSVQAEAFGKKSRNLKIKSI
jgi:hypothetical protein